MVNVLPHTTEIHEAPFSCVLALAGKVWQHQSAVERGLSAFGASVLWWGECQGERPVFLGCNNPSIHFTTKHFPPVRAQTTLANGLHGLNPRNTGTSTPEDAPFGLFVRDRATLRVQRWKRALLGMNDFLQGLWVERLGAGRIPIHPW